MGSKKFGRIGLDEIPRLEDAGILGGLPVDGGILWCATERNTKAQMDKLIETVKAVIA